MPDGFDELLKLVALKAAFEHRFGELMRAVRQVATTSQLGVKWGQQSGEDIEFTFLGRRGRIRLGHATVAGAVVGEVSVCGIGSDGVTHGALANAYLDADGKVRLGDSEADAPLNYADPAHAREIAAHLFTPIASLK